LTFFVPGIPRTKGNWKAVCHPKTGKALLVPKSRKSVPWEESVAWAAKQMIVHDRWHKRPAGVAVSVSLAFSLPRPKSHLKANGRLRKGAPLFPASKSCGDRDKLDRAVLDAMTGIVYDDDSQVCDGGVGKRYADGCPAGVQVTVRELVEP
jgi:crossover junction endodeoxyribonuclease RusA